MEFENLLTLIKTVSDSELTGFKYEENGVKINLSKQQDVVINQTTAMPANVTAYGMAPQMTGDMMTAQTGSASAAASVAAGTAAGMTAAADAGTDAAETVKAGKLVNSPLVGTFYAASSEDAQAFVSVGDKVKKGQTLAIVEAMKLMNEIESEYTGTVVEILAQNGQGVEYGQPLFRIEE